MEIKIVDRSTQDRYIKFCKEIYKDNPYYRDNMSEVLKGILSGKAQICKSSKITPVMVMKDGNVLAVCIFAVVDRMKDTLQITFFEALEQQEEAVDRLMDFGRKLAKEQGIKKMLVGLNFHVNYGLGLLADSYDTAQSFGSSYNPPYYIDYFKKYADEEVNLVSYITKMDGFQLPGDSRIMDRIHGKYTVRKAEFKHLKREAEIYTYLNNHAFRNHDFYYERRVEEDLELFNEFKLLLKEENLLFLEHEGKPAGFMLWYPDYNELIGVGESVGIKTVIKNKLFANKIKKFKIVELGVLPELQKNGAVLALFQQCYQIVKDRYQLCESGWILEDNRASKGFGIRWADSEYKHFKVFRINV
ncbi:MAG: hypothetical protein ACOYVK_22255 [Bacillota bacterium]